MPAVYTNTLANAQSALRAVAAATILTCQQYQVQLVQAQEIGQVADVQQFYPMSGQGLPLTNAGMLTPIQTTLLQAIGMFGPTVGIDRPTMQASLAQGILLLNQYMLENSIEVKQRGVAYGAAAAAGGNTGNALLYIQEDAPNGELLDTPTIETVTWRCLGASTQNSQIGLEIYEVSGAGTFGDSPLQDVGPGTPLTQMQAIGGGRSTMVTVNPSFDSPFNTADASSDTKIPGWTIITGAANIAYDDETYAQDRGGTQASLLITGNCKLQFNFRNNGVAMDALTPIINGLFWSADNTGATITVRIGPAASGGLSTAQAISNTSSVFQRLANVSKNAATPYPWTFDTDGDPVLEIEVSGYTGTPDIWIDDVFCEPFSFVAGRYAAIVSGVTPSVLDDAFTQACTLTTGSGSVELTGGGSGSVNTITVGGVSILPAAVSFTSTLAATAAAVVSAINAQQNRTAPVYYADVPSGAIIRITPIVPVAGTITVTSTVTTITKTDTNITGGAIGTIQDMIVRAMPNNALSAPVFLPSAAAATSGWEDPS